MSGKIFAVSMTALLLACAGVYADSVAWREGGGSGYTDVTCDDTYMNGGWETPADLSAGEYMQASYASGSYSPGRVMLIGWADLFTLVPASSGGGSIVIDSASLALTSNTVTTFPDNITMSRILTDWLTGAAGTNESNVNRLYSNVASSTSWASGGFSSADWYDNNNMVTAFPQSWGQSFALDLTQLMQDMYDNGENNGFAIWISVGNTGTASVGSSEMTSRGIAWRPALTMTYHYEAGASVPEPGTMLLIGTGVLGVVGYVRRRRIG